MVLVSLRSRQALQQRKAYFDSRKRQKANVSRVVRSHREPRRQGLRKISAFGAQTGDKNFPLKGLTRDLYYASLCDYTTLNGAAYQLKLNSAFDVDLSNTGHQPMDYDNYCSSNGPYQSYTVDSTIVKVTVINNGTTGIWLAGGMWSNITSPATGSLDNYRENGGPVIFIPSNGYSTSGSITLKCTNIHKFLGLGADDDTIRAAYNANPATLLYAFIGTFTTSGAATSSLYPISIQVKQRIKFSNKQLSAQN